MVCQPLSSRALRLGVFLDVPLPSPAGSALSPSALSLPPYSPALRVLASNGHGRPRPALAAPGDLPSRVCLQGTVPARAPASLSLGMRAAGSVRDKLL